jgi:hypothetical protein
MLDRFLVSGEDRRIGPSAAKLFCTEMAGQVADLAVQLPPPGVGGAVTRRRRASAA